MNTAVTDELSVIEVDPELRKRADKVFEELGTSASGTVNSLLKYVVISRRLPEYLKRPPIPCIDDMTEDELDALIEEGMNDVKAGRTYSLEEARRIIGEQYDEI